MSPPVPGAEAMAPGTFVSPLLMLAVGAGLVVAIGIVVQAFRLAKGHADQAAPLVTRISDALVLDPALGNLPVTVTAHSRPWRWSPVTIEVGGRVPTLQLREAALAVVWREVSTRAGGPYRVEDRVAIAGRPACHPLPEWLEGGQRLIPVKEGPDDVHQEEDRAVAGDERPGPLDGSDRRR